MEECRLDQQEELGRLNQFIKDIKFQMEDVNVQLDNKRDEVLQ